MGAVFLARVIIGFGNVIIMLICLQAIMSWFVNVFPAGVAKFYNVVCMIVDPFVRPFRKLTMRFAYTIGIDLSPLIAIIVIETVCRILAMIIISV